MLVPEKAPNVTTIERVSVNSTRVRLRWDYTNDIEIINSYNLHGYHVNITGIHPEYTGNCVQLGYVISMTNNSWNIESNNSLEITEECEAYKVFNLSIAAYNEMGVGVANHFCYATPSLRKLSV